MSKLRQFSLILAVVTILAPLGLGNPGFAKKADDSALSPEAIERCTRDNTMAEALRSMSQVKLASKSLHLLLELPMRVVFKDMKSLGKGLANYDALSWINDQGEHIIFVNEKHRHAPTQAVAAMLAHEAMHNDPYNSLKEEVAGWTVEARVWQAFKKLYPELDAIPPGKYPLVDRENRLDTEEESGNLDNFVRTNPGYRNLPDRSPGFGINASDITPNS
jgi:hypothetical protein